MANIANGIGLLVFGFILTLFGAFTYTSCASQPAIGGVSPNCSGLGVIIALGIVLIIAGIATIVYLASTRPTRIQEVPDPSIPPPIIRPVIIQQTIVRGATQIQCAYCGYSYDSTSGSCPSCGAPQPKRQTA